MSKRLIVIVPISNYYGTDSWLECEAEGNKGRMFLLVEIDGGCVRNVDYGYGSLEEAIRVARSTKNAKVITPAPSAILPPETNPFE